MISFAQFVQQNPSGKSVATPEGTFLGECVSLIRQILAQVYGYNIGAMGNAYQWASQTNQARLATIGFVWKPGDTNFQDGDILVWGDDPGTWTGANGHISSYSGGKLYNQNYGNSGRISFNSFFAPGYLGRYTKENNMIKDSDIGPLRIIIGDVEGWGDIVHTGVKDAEIKAAWVGKPWVDLINHAYTVQKVHRQDLMNKVDALTKQLSATHGIFEQVTEPLYRKK